MKKQATRRSTKSPVNDLPARNDDTVKGGGTAKPQPYFVVKFQTTMVSDAKLGGSTATD